MLFTLNSFYKSMLSKIIFHLDYSNLELKFSLDLKSFSMGIEFKLFNFKRNILFDANII